MQICVNITACDESHSRPQRWAPEQAGRLPIIPKRTKGKHHVVFYTKEGCCLCDEARETLGRLGNDFPLVVEEVPITSDLVLYARYKTVIPVVIIDGEFTVGARIEEDELRLYLNEANGE